MITFPQTCEAYDYIFLFSNTQYSNYILLKKKRTSVPTGSIKQSPSPILFSSCPLHTQTHTPKNY